MVSAVYARVAAFLQSSDLLLPQRQAAACIPPLGQAACMHCSEGNCTGLIDCLAGLVWGEGSIEVLLEIPRHQGQSYDMFLSITVSLLRVRAALHLAYSIGQVDLRHCPLSE